MTDKIPMKRCGTIEEIAGIHAYMLCLSFKCCLHNRYMQACVAGLAAYIGSPENSFTTAFCFDATGGRSTY